MINCPQFDRKWADNDASGLYERVKRVLLIEDECRMSKLHESVPADMLLDLPPRDGYMRIYRGVPNDLEDPVIRPGDWVSLSHDYAALHGGNSSRVISRRVAADDIVWAGTDLSEFFYAPRILFRLVGESCLDALNRLGRAPFDGNVPFPLDNRPLIRLAQANFQLEIQAEHGLAHWSRVYLNGRRLAMETGADLDVVRTFAFLHDVCRQSDLQDKGHGLRASEFVQAHRDFLALDRTQIAILRDTIEGHSEGEVSDNPTIGTCWDADRLDLFRCGQYPDPRFLSTEPARDPAFLASAVDRSEKWLEHQGHLMRQAGRRPLL